MEFIKHPLARALLVGVATGGRSTAGFTALAWSAPDTDPKWLRSAWTRGLTALSAVGEGVVDKLPKTPSRLDPPGLIVRVVAGGLSAGHLSRRHGYSGLAGVVAGSAGAVLGSLAGSRWRSLAATQFGPDLPGALIEDALTATVAIVATR
jgi:uncharacterized membrane protein